MSGEPLCCPFDVGGCHGNCCVIKASLSTLRCFGCAGDGLHHLGLFSYCGCYKGSCHSFPLKSGCFSNMITSRKRCGIATCLLS